MVDLFGGLMRFIEVKCCFVSSWIVLNSGKNLFWLFFLGGEMGLISCDC